MTGRVIVVGSFNTDLVTFMARLPVPGETVHGHDFIVGPGGKGSNQAVAAARMGGAVTFIGRVGQDSFGQSGLQMWADEQIETGYVARDPERPTGVATIFVEDSGENVIVVALGANLALDAADIDRAAPALDAADVLLVQLEVAVETAHHALRAARERGVTTILNPAPAAALPPDMLALADYLTPNETELAALLDGANDPARLLSRPDQTVILTQGAAGVSWVRSDGSGSLPIFPVEVRDTTGAGDAFNGALAVALAEGQDLEGALRFASAAAALCVTRAGAAASMPRRAEVDALLAGR
jgi:ribokinase